MISSKNNLDNTRKYIKKFLIKNNIYIDQNLYYNFINFIKYDDEIYFDYVVSCCGLYNKKNSIKRIQYIFNKFCKNKENMSFKELVHLDKEWFPYFKENIYENGQKKLEETRYGVSRLYANDIMNIKKQLIDQKSIDTSMLIYFTISRNLYKM